MLPAPGALPPAAAPRPAGPAERPPRSAVAPAPAPPPPAADAAELNHRFNSTIFERISNGKRILVTMKTTAQLLPDASDVVLSEARKRTAFNALRQRYEAHEKATGLKSAAEFAQRGKADKGAK